MADERIAVKSVMVPSMLAGSTKMVEFIKLLSPMMAGSPHSGLEKALRNLESHREAQT